MPARRTLDELEFLRRRHTELSVENAQLRGRGAASRGNIEMLQLNTEMRRRVEQLRHRLPKADLGPSAQADDWLTVHQIASLLNTTAEHASRLLAKVETQFDNNGVQVISRERFEQFVVDTAAGNDPSRFL